MYMYTHIYIYVHKHVYIYIYIYTELLGRGDDTASLRTKTLDLRVFDPSRILILRVGVPRPTGNVLEILSQGILVGMIDISREIGHTVGNPHRAQLSQFVVFELALLLKLDKQFPVEQFEASRAIRASSISVSSTLPPSYLGRYGYSSVVGYGTQGMHGAI